MERRAYRDVEAVGWSTDLWESVAATKLRPPRPRPGAVLRARLHRRLSEATRRPVTLLSAPAGSGKTALATAWLGDGAGGRPVAWLTLDPDDDEPRRFWAGVVAALALAMPERMAGLEGRADSAALPSALTNALADLPTPPLLVVDGLHELSEPAVFAAVGRLVRVADGLGLLLVARGDPPLPLDRLRVAGRLEEVRGPDLAFTRPEAGALMADDGLDLSADVVDRLWERSRGWAAPLVLAARDLRGHADPDAYAAAVSGAAGSIGDYQRVEVLERQAPDVRDFLVDTSVAGDLDGDLVELLSGRRDAAALVSHLDHTDVPVETTPDGRRRYPPLFRELLEAELARGSPARAAGLHGRAAHWRLDRNEVSAAAAHARASGDEALAVEVAGRHWISLLVRGDFPVLHSLVDDLPPERLAGDARLMLAGAAVHMLGGDQLAGDDLLAAAGGALASMPAEERTRFELERVVVAMLQARLTGNLNGFLRSGERVLRGYARRAARGQDRELYALILLITGTAELWSGHPERAAGHLDAALARGRELGLDYFTAYTLAHRAAVHSALGQLRLAEALGEEVLDSAQRHGWSERLPTALALIVLGAGSFERDDLPRARELLDRARAALTNRADAPARAELTAWRCRVLRGLGRPDAGLVELQAMRPTYADWPLTPILRDGLAAEEALLLAAGGHEGEAMALLDTAMTRPHAAELRVARARLALRRPDLARAAADAQAALEPDRPGAARTRIGALIVLALVRDAEAEHAAAAEALERALDAAEPGGHLRAFLRLGPMDTLLRRQIRFGTRHRAFIDELIAAGAGPSRRAAMLADPLSERELVLLRYLPTILSNQEIADELVISLNTVKTHLRHLYRKLGVSGRREAVRRGRTLGLLSPSAREPGEDGITPAG